MSSVDYRAQYNAERDGNGQTYRGQAGASGTGSLAGSGVRSGAAVRGAHGSDGLRAPDSEDTGFASLDELMEAVRQEAEQVGRETDEIKLLIRQAAAELDRANQRKTQMAARVREMEARLETFARQEIRTTYLAANEAEMRAFMMQEQRDRLQDKQKAYDRYQRSLQQVHSTLVRLQNARQERGEDLDPAVAQLARLVQTQEQLRRRIAQHLHDGPAQALANVVLKAEICEKTIEHDMGRARHELNNLKSVVNATLQETRKFIFDLRPMTLDDLGLIPTLKRYTQDLSNKSGIQMIFSLRGPEQRMPSPVEVSLFRIAQEALSNVIAHAEASQALLTLHIHEVGVTMVIEDDGRGFDVEEALAEANTRRTVGLTSMYERAEMLKTRLIVESRPGRGTKIELTVPRHGTGMLPPM